ncbi:hypothetical protein CP973_22570 [Streptomyces albofaciens JCM 4342]|nr:hypothetical protein CP973_22570 [Streptomyces albofaciens JCM 4342]
MPTPCRPLPALNSRPVRDWSSAPTRPSAGPAGRAARGPGRAVRRRIKLLSSPWIPPGPRSPLGSRIVS